MNMVGKSVAEKAHDKLREAAIRTAKEENATEAAAKAKIDSQYWANLQKKWAQEAEDAKTGELDGKITDMKDTTAGEVYGDKAKDPDRAVIQLEITASDGKKFHEAFSHPEGAGSWRNSKFKLGLFMKKYASFPHIGQSVKVGFDSDGFYTLTL